MPWRLPSSGPSPSTRYLPGARGSACGEAGSGGGAQWLWSQSFPGLCRLQPNCFMRQALSWPRSAVSRGLLWVRCLGPGSAAALLLFGSQTGVRVLAAMLRHLLTIADAGRFSGPRCRAGCSHPVSHLAPGRAPEVGFQTRGFFQLWPVRRPPLQPVCSSSPGSVHSPSDPGAVGSDPGFYRDSAYVVVMPALMCLGAEGLMHAADTCVHSDGCGASPAAPAASCLPPRPRLLGARAACPASLPRACKFVLLPVGWAAGHPWPRRGSRRPGTC